MNKVEKIRFLITDLKNKGLETRIITRRIINVLFKDRFRFTLAHELGHILLHRTPSENQEDEANLLASSLLMPDRDIIGQFSGRFSFEKLQDMKYYWGVSMQALLRKGRDLERLSESNYKYYCIELSKKGYRLHEPIDLNEWDETPRIYKELLEAHINELDYTAADLAGLVGLNENEFLEYAGVNTKKPQLKLVINNNGDKDLKDHKEKISI